MQEVESSLERLNIKEECKVSLRKSLIVYHKQMEGACCKMLSGSKTAVTSSCLDDLKQNATNIADRKKLVEILDHFSKGTTEEVFLVQNEKKLNDKGVMLSLEYFAELLSCKEAMNDVLNYLLEEEAREQPDFS